MHSVRQPERPFVWDILLRPKVSVIYALKFREAKQASNGVETCKPLLPVALPFPASQGHAGRGEFDSQDKRAKRWIDRGRRRGWGRG